MKVAIVTPWFGDAIEADAALRARRLARAFAANGHDVDVLATASRGPDGPWDRNDLSLEGASEDGYRIRRFPVDAREASAFDRADAFLRLHVPRNGRATLPAGVADAYAHNIRSKALLDDLRAGSDGRDAFLFMPYRWQPVLEGVPLVAARAFVEPCLKREAYAFLPSVANAIHAARGLFFGSDAEYRLALHIFGPGIRDKSIVASEWIEEPARSAPPDLPGRLEAVRERFVLYLGPRDETRNVGMLVAAFRAFRAARPAASLKLVLAGPGTESYEDAACGVLDLGELDGDTSKGLLGCAIALAEPSYDRVSTAVLEAFALSRPVAVNADGPWAATFAQPESKLEPSDAGWIAATKADWTDFFAAIDRIAPAEHELLGRNVRRYFERNATAAGAIGRYAAAFETASQTGRAAPIYHMVASRDLTNDAVRRGRALADYSEYAGAPASAVVGVDALRHGAVVVHSPNGDHLRAALLESTGIAGLVYDTVAFAASPREAFDVASVARFGIGTSESAVRFLRDAGLSAAAEIPFVTGTRCWDVPSDAEMARLLGDGKVNCLYAGPLDFNAGVDRLIAAFAFLLALDVDARLVLCGPVDAADAVQTSLRSVVAENGLSERVVFLDSSEAARVAAAYRAASIFWTLGSTASALSPLVDALWFDLPVLAHASAPCAALLGEAGLLLRDGADAVRIAGLAKILIHDDSLRGKMLAVQARRREELTFDRSAGAQCARELLLASRSLETSPS